jgi:NhaP-type Na+/H+ or K+/H+ antiporter
MNDASSFALWAIIIGILLIGMVLSGSLLKRLPLSTAMFYLLAGVILGPAGFALLTPNPLLHGLLLERISEVAMLISLFAAGLKLGLPLTDRLWRMPLRLVFISMTLTVALIALIGVYGLGLSLGAAILLGGILAPTDPVLAADVQVASATDRDWLRFSLTGEGGFNDGAALPFVLLGLGLLGLHDLGPWGWHWLAVEVFWAIAIGLLLGALLGTLVGKLVVYLRSRHHESLGLDEFLALGLVALAYGVAEFCEANGFLAVFAAGLALQRVKGRDKQDGTGLAAAVGRQTRKDPSAEPQPASAPQHASARMMQGVRGFNEQLERIAEVTVVLVVGAMLAFVRLDFSVLVFVFVLFVLIRPLSVWLGLFGTAFTGDQRRMIGWFGIRGIGSVYYLMFAISHGLPSPLAEQFITITLTTVAASILLHGISVTPLMDLYDRRKARFKIQASRLKQPRTGAKSQ